MKMVSIKVEPKIIHVPWTIETNQQKKIIMSRFLVNLGEQKEFIYGFDHALGYFYEVWDNSISEEEAECIVEDKNSLFNKMSKGEMVEAMEKYGAKVEHIKKAALDLPF